MATEFDALFSVESPGSVTAFFSTDYGAVTTLAPATAWDACSKLTQSSCLADGPFCSPPTPLGMRTSRQ